MCVCVCACVCARACVCVQALLRILYSRLKRNDFVSQSPPFPQLVRWACALVDAQFPALVLCQEAEKVILQLRNVIVKQVGPRRRVDTLLLDVYLVLYSFLNQQVFRVKKLVGRQGAPEPRTTC